MGLPSHSCWVSLAIWIIPATPHKWKRAAITPASKLVLNSPIPEGYQAELTQATRQCTGQELNPRSFDHQSDALTTTLPSHVNVVRLSLDSEHLQNSFQLIRLGLGLVLQRVGGFSWTLLQCVCRRTKIEIPFKYPLLLTVLL